MSFQVPVLLIRLFFCLVVLFASPFAAARDEWSNIGDVAARELPTEAQQTLALIDRSGPFPYKRDGVVFQNRERLLPARDQGCYREYTVPTPGSRDRGARRVVAACEGVQYYSDDHYRSFRKIQR